MHRRQHLAVIGYRLADAAAAGGHRVDAACDEFRRVHQQAVLAPSSGRCP